MGDIGNATSPVPQRFCNLPLISTTSCDQLYLMGVDECFFVHFACCDLTAVCRVAPWQNVLQPAESGWPVCMHRRAVGATIFPVISGYYRSMPWLESVPEYKSSIQIKLDFLQEKR